MDRVGRMPDESSSIATSIPILIAVLCTHRRCVNLPGSFRFSGWLWIVMTLNVRDKGWMA